MSPEKILFKYRSLEPDARAHTLRAISHLELRFSSLCDFNDPFEARVSIVMDGDDEAWRREFHSRRPSDDKLRAMISELERGVRKDAEKVGMCCLSAKLDDILLWSHYASRHRGLCFGFRTTGDSILWDAQPVEYSSEYPVIDYFQMTREQRVRAMLLRKARAWEYEQEWRALRTGPEPGIAHYPADMLASIVLGSEIAPADRQAVLRAAAALAVPVDLYQARRSGTAYVLDLARIQVQ